MTRQIGDTVKLAKGTVIGMYALRFDTDAKVTHIHKMTTKQINKNDKIKTVYGKWLTVESVYDNMIYVYESQNVIHIGNVVEVTK